MSAAVLLDAGPLGLLTNPLESLTYPSAIHFAGPPCSEHGRPGFVPRSDSRDSRNPSDPARTFRPVLASQLEDAMVTAKAGRSSRSNRE
ncbi:MAG: hypothetical protein ACHRXM_39175 [Isosphaerales bacterium]